MSVETFAPLRGHCTCKTITYEVTAPFLCVHCCHCTWCQRETGSAFVLNAIIETSHFRITSDVKPMFVDTPSASGDGQMMARCPKCYVVLYSDYDGDGKWVTFVRAATLDDASKKNVRPTAHIYTTTKMDWIDLTSEKKKGIPIFEAHYPMKDVWTKEANERFDALKAKMEEADRASKSSEVEGEA